MNRTTNLVMIAALLTAGCADHQEHPPQAQPAPSSAATTEPPPDWDTIERCEKEIRAGRAFVSYQPDAGPCADLPTFWWDRAVQTIDDEYYCTRTCEGEDYRCTPICEGN